MPNVIIMNLCFNSRTRKGCDTGEDAYTVYVWFQFTHPQGVRLLWRHNKLHSTSFNSRTRKGCDPLFTQSATCWWFQFTHPQGVRCDGIVCDAVGAVSIHAPARGAMASVAKVWRATCFNSRTRKGCDIRGVLR